MVRRSRGEQDGQRCHYANSGDTCSDECSSDADCGVIGFPPHYLCDKVYGGFSVGHCVPPECAGNVTIDNGYCNLFR